MTKSKLWPAAILASCLCNCSGATSPQADADKLMQTSREWSKVAASGNMDAVLGYFDDNAVMISEGQPPVRGKQAIREYLEETAKVPGFKIEWDPQEAKVSGDMGYLIERTSGHHDWPARKPCHATIAGADRLAKAGKRVLEERRRHVDLRCASASLIRSLYCSSGLHKSDARQDASIGEAW